MAATKVASAGRPRVPRISRRRALEVALAIIDNEGLGALSMRRLGDALQVNKASLYHHFTNKEAILVGATELALAEVTAPRNEADSWRVWMPLNAYLLRSALIAHPDLIPIMLRRVSLGIGRAEVEAAVARLQAEGVPEAAVVPLMESLEMVAIVSALQVVGGASIAAGTGEAPKYVLYQQARNARGLTDEEQFEVILGSVMSSVESAVALKVAAAAASAPRRRSTASPRRRAAASPGRQPAAPARRGPAGST
jgi:TetR/AcrR family transcriptional regulator, tetracycline repressor protein